MNFIEDIVKKINQFLYIKPKKETLGFTEEDRIKLRKEVSNILFSVLSGEKTVLYALSNFPKIMEDDSVNVCFHILMHLEADEDIRKNDRIYREEQDEFILNMAELLQNGESIPANIINEYKEYYKESLIYPVINKKTIIERLKKFINI